MSRTNDSNPTRGNGPASPGGEMLLRRLAREGLSGLDESALCDRVDSGLSQKIRDESALLEELAADAALLRASGADVRVPAGIIAGVQERLDQEAMRELLNAERDAPAISLPRARSRGGLAVLRELGESLVIRRAAMAAGVLLAVGAGYFVLEGVRRAWPGGGTNGLGSGRTIARIDPGTATDPGVAAVTALAPAPVPDERTDAPTELAGRDPENAGEASGAAGKRSANTDPALALAGPSSPPMSIERALQLAQEGRLVVRVRTQQALGIGKKLDSMAERGVLALGGARVTGGRFTSLELSNLDPSQLELAGLPRAYASLSIPVGGPGEDGRGGGSIGPGPRSLAPTALASDEGIGGPRGAGEHGVATLPGESGPFADLLGGGSGADAEHGPRVRGVYLAELPPRAADLETLKRLIISAAGKPGVGPMAREASSVEFEELPADAASGGSASRGLVGDALDPEQVLWWTGASDRWILGVRVPVVLQGERP